MRIKQIALIAFLTLILLPIQTVFASRLAARTSSVRPFNSLQAATPTAIPPTPVSTNAAPSGPPLSLTLMLLFTCCALGLVFGILILGFVAGTGNRNEVEKSKKEK